MLASIGQPRHFQVVFKESGMSEKLAYFMLGIALCLILGIVGSPSASMLYALLVIGVASTYTALGK